MSDIVIRNVRLSFPTLYKPVEFKAGDGKPRWSATFLIEKGSENHKLIEEAIKAAAAETFGDKADAMLRAMRGQKNQDCYLDGATKAYDGYEGVMALACHRARNTKNGGLNPAPRIIDRDKSPLHADSGKPYAGCYVNAKVAIYCQKGENPGVRASFSVVQFAKDGDAFSNSEPNDSDFDVVEESEEGLF